MQFNLHFVNYLLKQRILRSGTTMCHHKLPQEKQKPEVALACGPGGGEIS